MALEPGVKMVCGMMVAGFARIQKDFRSPVKFDGSHTNPKRKRGTENSQLLSSLALRVSVVMRLALKSQHQGAQARKRLADFVRTSRWV